MQSGAHKCKSMMALVLGILFLLGTMGYWPSFTFATYWPLFLILWGVHGTFCKCGMGGCEKGGKEEKAAGACCGKGGKC